MNNSAKLLFVHLILSLLLLVISLLLAISRLKKLISFTLKLLIPAHSIFQSIKWHLAIGEKAFHREVETGQVKFPF